MLQPSNHLHGLPLDLLQELHILLVQRAPRDLQLGCSTPGGSHEGKAVLSRVCYDSQNKLVHDSQKYRNSGIRGLKTATNVSQWEDKAQRGWDGEQEDTLKPLGDTWHWTDPLTLVLHFAECKLSTEMITPIWQKQTPGIFNPLFYESTPTPLMETSCMLCLRYSLQFLYHVSGCVFPKCFLNSLSRNARFALTQVMTGNKSQEDQNILRQKDNMMWNGKPSTPPNFVWKNRELHSSFYKGKRITQQFRLKEISKDHEVHIFVGKGTLHEIWCL